MTTHQDLPVVLHNENRGLLTIEEGRLDVLQLSKDGRPPKRLLSCPIRYFLRARLTPATQGKKCRLDLHTLIAKGTRLRLSKMHVLVEPINVPEAEEWVNVAMSAAYENVKPFRRVLVLVNPVGGKGKAKAIVRDTVLALLEAAGCVVETRETEHRSHAEEIAKEIELNYDVIATASGDGLVYEVLNGLASRPDARKALRVPIAPIPTGSANAICTNLFGPKDTFNIELACLNIIKGQLLPLDLCSVMMLPSNETRWSFLAQAVGLMVDLDIGTENLRWMGDTRFIVGFLRGVASSKTHQCRIRMKVVQEDKVEMARSARERASQLRARKVVGGGTDPITNAMKMLAVNGSTPISPGTTTDNEAAPPVANEASNDITSAGVTNGTDDVEIVNYSPLPDIIPLVPDDTWTTIESVSTKGISPVKRDSVAVSSGQSGGWVDGEGILYAYATPSLMWIDRDLLQWPVSTAGEGLIDIVVQSIAPRTQLISMITGAEKGDAYWMECQHYYKVSAFTVENLDKANQKIFTIDGEAFPYDVFHVQVHPRLANVLSLDGRLFLSDFLKRPETKVSTKINV